MRVDWCRCACVLWVHHAPVWCCCVAEQKQRQFIQLKVLRDARARSCTHLKQSASYLMRWDAMRSDLLFGCLWDYRCTQRARQCWLPTADDLLLPPIEDLVNMRLQSMGY